jgi:signal transduction histidine kinase
MSTSVQKIRPAARLLRTIGQDLIKDSYAAVVELIKNAYDADSPEVIVRFIYSDEKNRLLIRLEDSGHGMSFDTVVNNWLVPATDDKFRRKRSGNGRVLQGRKGIGRFSAAVLGERILLETTQSGVTTSMILDMDELESIEYLDQLELDVSVENTGNENGTIIEIEKDNVSTIDVQEIWTSKQLHKLLVELRSLISPEDVYKAASVQGYKINYDAFDIKLIFQEFPIDEYSNREIKILPFPVLDLYDYRIFGTVDEKGRAKLRFENQNIPSLPAEEFQLKITFDDELMDYPGGVYIDLRVYDRDPDSIDNIIKRGLKDPDTGEYVGKHEARRILNEFYGVGIYREQFRIRPYGDPSFDWLALDKKRVQKPAYKIGHDQVIGFVYVHSEEKSGLTEKSARDGLMENQYYSGLVHVVSLFVNELEGRRVRYREKAQKGGRNRTIDEEINHLFDFDTVARKISRELDDLGMPRKDRETIGKVVNEALDFEKQKKSGVAKKIKDTIAIYQGQATLGKITHVLLHEGRKHIKYISETVPRIIKWANDLSGTKESELMEKLEDRSSKVISHAKGLSYLFKKIEPLARTRRSPARKFNLNSILENSFEIFSSELKDLGIVYEIHSEVSDATVVANEMDLITIFSNLIENSVYWVRHQRDKPKKILAHIYSDDKDLVVEFNDSGPGFQGDNLDLMFEPGYSMKPDGTGLGLALAGEAIARIGGNIEASHSDTGAVFTILFKGNK